MKKEYRTAIISFVILAILLSLYLLPDLCTNITDKDFISRYALSHPFTCDAQLWLNIFIIPLTSFVLFIIGLFSLVEGIKSKKEEENGQNQI